MPKLATAHSLNDYPRLPISQYKDALRQSDKLANKVTLSYGYRGKQYRYDVAVTTTPCHYGSHRYWWLCPKCARRVSVLYCAGSYVCRHCIGANYRSQHLQPIDTQFTKAEAIRQRLGWQAGIAYGNQGRPKGMHFKTFYKLVDEHDKIVRTICGASLAMI